MQLHYAPLEAYRMADNLPKWERLAAYAALNRLNALCMIQRAGSGHIGSSFSSMDIITYMHLEHPEIAFFSSKGHDVPAFYASLIATGTLPIEALGQLRRVGGLPGHPELRTPGIVAHSGSLGMGISKAKGLIRANRMKGITQRVAVLLGDGELQEGQNWEALMDANFKELIVIVDRNRLSTEQEPSLPELKARLNMFGCGYELDGHNYEHLDNMIGAGWYEPCLILLANTIKGKGVSFMEGQPQYHSGCLTPDEYARAVVELKDAIRHYLPDFWDGLVCVKAPQRQPNALIEAYSKALDAEAYVNPMVVALDADLAADCGLTLFREHHPARFVECGIAEQDMVSQAGMLAAQGFVPLVHSFAAFLTRRSCEQIYDNACQPGLRVVYVGSLAGPLPDGPGPSHEALCDVELMRTMPGPIQIFEPHSPEEVAEVLHYCIYQAPGSTYIRLLSNLVGRCLK